MDALIKNNFFKIFVSLVVLLLFSADRNLLITEYLLGGQSSISFITILSIFFIFFLATSFLLKKGTFISQKSHRNLLFSSLILASYFLFHEIIFGDNFISAKYAIFLSIIILFLSVRYDLFYIFKIIGLAGGIVSIVIIVQQILLLSLYGGNINEFDVVLEGETWNRPVSCDFVSPFGLGFFERCASSINVTIGDFILNRSLFFSTEPKYAASIMLVTFSALLISRTESITKKVFIASHLLAFSFVLSASAILIIFISIFFIYFEFIGSKIYSSLIFLSPILIFPILLNSLLQVIGIDGYLYARIYSAAFSVGTEAANTGGVQEFSLFGESFGSSCFGQICNDGQGLLANLIITYGVVGFILFWSFFHFSIKSMFKITSENKVDYSTKLGLMILLNTYVVFNIYFFSDIFNMFGTILLLIIILLPEYIMRHQSLLDKNM